MVLHGVGERNKGSVRLVTVSVLMVVTLAVWIKENRHGWITQEEIKLIHESV